MIYPPKISSGEKVAIVAPAGLIDDKDIEEAIMVLESWGLNVGVGAHVFDKYNFFSSSDDGRFQDFQQALDDSEVRAIFCARGGYGSGRIIDRLDFERFLEFPKWIIGFSDITLLHLRLHGMGVASLHGPMARQIGSSVDEESVAILKKMLFQKTEIKYHLADNELNIEGKATSRIVGGNLTLICNNIGTSSDIDLNGKILFIEEIGERLYAVDRHLNQLDRSGGLRNLAGLIAGQFSDLKDTDPSYGKSAYEIVNEYVHKYKFPVCFGLESGHEKKNLTIPLSYICDLDVNQIGASLIFS